MKLVSKLKSLYITRIFAAKNGALVIWAMFIATFLTSCTPFFNVSLKTDILMDGVEERDALIPVYVGVLGLVLYLLFLFGDFFSALLAARKRFFDTPPECRCNSFIEPSKLWKTISKFIAVTLLIFMLVGLCLLSIILKDQIPANICIWIMVFILVAADLFEFSSIGNNIEAYSGRKPDIFTFVDGLFTIFRKKVYTKAENIT